MKALKGKVISLKMNKTATVEVERIVAHPVYLKRYKRTKKYQVHAEQEPKVGQVVSFIPCKPISKTKKWIIVGEKKAEGKKQNKAKKTKKTKGAEK